MKNVKTILAILFISGATMAFKTSENTKSENASNTQVKSTTANMASLSSYYKADDGSFVYVRQIKNKIYAFAEHFSGSAASVISGTINNNTINAKYYYVPKGEAKGKGTISFRMESGGRKLIIVSKTGTNYNIKSMSAMTLPDRVPAIRRAWYRGNTPDNLTGRWMSQNVGESHILETGNEIIMYSSGYRKGNNKRPQFSSIFMGKRNGNTITGSYVDLPLGHTKSYGEAGFSVEGTHKLVVNHKYYPGVKHERVLADTREVMNKTVKRNSPTKTLKPSTKRGANHQ